MVTFDPAGKQNEIEWLYDAKGNKQVKRVNGAIVKEYLPSGVEYNGDKIEAIYHAEGRAIPLYNPQLPDLIDSFRYEYVIRDHLGNGRVYFSDWNEDSKIQVGGIGNEVMQENHYYPFGLNHEGPFYPVQPIQNQYQYNGKELNEEFGLGWNDYGARWYDAAMSRMVNIDPAAEEYSSMSPYAYVGNMPTIAIDPDGRRIFFIGGAGNDQVGWNYVNRWKDAFEKSGIQGFQRLDVSHDNPERLQRGGPFGMPFGDMMFSSGFASSRYGETVNRAGYQKYKIYSKVVAKAVKDIKSNLSSSPLTEEEQLNLAGYSYGSVVQAHTALTLADEGKFVDNLILIGSPISSESELYEELSTHKNIGNIIRIDIDDDFFSDPAGFDMLRGTFQNLGIDGPHFDLARPGEEANERILQTTDELAKKGVK